MKEAKLVTSPTEQQEEKKKKKRKFILILLFILIGFLVFGGAAAIVGIRMHSSYKSTASTYLDVTVDPIIVTGAGENHINGAQRFVFGQDQQDTYTTHIKTQLSYGQYIYYDYILDNKGVNNIGIVLNLNVEQQENATISYCVNDSEEKTATNSLLDITSAPHTKTTVKVYIKIDDLQKDTFVTGTLVLILTEAGGNDGE